MLHVAFGLTKILGTYSFNSCILSEYFIKQYFIIFELSFTTLACCKSVLCLEVRILFTTGQGRVSDQEMAFLGFQKAADGK